jgi:hypothetical protein
MEGTLYDWAGEAASALDLPPEAQWLSDPITARRVLELAKELAHGVARPAAPVGTFLAGVAIGLRGAADPSLLELVSARLIATLEDAAPGPAGE